jgi:hypothetical protein
MRKARVVRGTPLPWIYKSTEEEMEAPYLNFSVRRPLLLASAPEHRAPLRFHLAFASPRAPSLIDMALPQLITVVDPLPWHRSTVTEFALHELENGV